MPKCDVEQHYRLIAKTFGGKYILAANNLAKLKIIPDSDDPCDHHYWGFSFDGDALISASVNGSLGPLARPSC